MRHFLALPFPVSHLTGGMVAPPREGCLVAPACPPQRLATSDPRALGPAVDLAPVTAKTDLHQPATTSTVVDPVAGLEHPNPAHRKAGQMGRDRGILQKGSFRARSRKRSHEGSGRTSPWAFTFPAAQSS